MFAVAAGQYWPRPPIYLRWRVGGRLVPVSNEGLYISGLVLFG